MAVCGVVCYVYSGAAEKCHAGKVVGGKGGRQRWEEKVGGKRKRSGGEEMALHGKG